MPVPKLNSVKRKESMFSAVHGLEIKEEPDFITKGYIATSHVDGGFFDSTRDVYVRDRVPKDTLDKWAIDINDGNPRANKVSVHHVREPVVAGAGIPGTARVDALPDGEYGLYVDSVIDKTKESFEDTKYRVDKGLIDSFSIEFHTRDPATGEYMPGAVHEEVRGDGSILRTLLPKTQLDGYTLASRPMQENAIMFKEVKEYLNSRIVEENKSKKNMEDSEKMSKEDKNKLDVTPEPQDVPEESKPEVEADTDVEDTTSDEEKKELKEYRAYKEMKTNEKKITETKEMIKGELKKALEAIPVENKVQKNTDNIEMKEFVEYKELFNKDSTLSIREQFRVAGRFAEAKGLLGPDLRQISTPTTAESRAYSIETKGADGRHIEFKGLGITTNQGSDYYLSAAELNDIFDPIVYNALNQKTTTWNLLPKDDFSNKGNNMVQFVLKTVANPSAGAFTGNAVTLGNITRAKYQTKFKKYQVGVEVDGDMIAAARGGPIGDAFAQEIMDSTDDLMSVLNLALFAESGAETDAEVLGFEYIADSAGNTTLYGQTRSSANYLSPASAADTFIDGASANLSIDNLRAAKRQSVENGSKLDNLVYIGSPIQGDKLRGIYDAAHRLVPTSSKFGFEGMMSFDGIPFFEDKDCGDDDVWLIDLETHRVAIWIPPTLEMLGKDSDSVKGFIKTYFAVYNRAIRRLVMIYDNATS